MRLKIFTLIIISLNVFILMESVPAKVILFSLLTPLLSFFVSVKNWRVLFKVTLLLFALVLLRLEFKTLLVVECAVAFILMLSSLKFWELEQEKDHFNMFIILALLEGTIFLLSTNFFIFIFGIIKILFYFYYIFKIRAYNLALLSKRHLLLLLLPSLLFSLVLFYTFPRFTRGFLTTQEMQFLVAGGSAQLDFRHLGPLSTSTELAFKVYNLEKEPLPFSILYWRSSVLWQFSNQDWTSANHNLKMTAMPTVPARFNYEVEVFQNLKEYLPILDGPSLVSQSNLAFNNYSDNSFRLKTISRGELFYSVSGTYSDRKTLITPLMKQKGLRLKSSRVDEIKASYFKNEGNANDEIRLKELIQIFKNKNFEYSLTPPFYDSLEDFLLNGRLGYCSHFASAFTYLARVYNLPARMINGYLGGQLNTYDNSIIVREADAHTWVEVYIQEKGWVRIDPTGLVAPGRIAMSADEFHRQLNPYLNILNFKIRRTLFQFKSVEEVGLWLDSLSSNFSSILFNFDRDNQNLFLKKFSSIPLPPGWLFSFSLIAFMFLFSFFFFLLGKKRRSRDERRYFSFLKKMRRWGVEKKLSETASQFCSRALYTLPKKARYINEEVTHYLNSFYK